MPQQVIDAGVTYRRGAHPHLTMKHIDGPLLVMRDGRLHWLTLWERLGVALGWHDAYSLERKYWRSDVSPER